ncbi:hypothetical protein GCM10010371_63440 [Streptomyces subrutilus]|uniref:Uncharacterized protein n=1 Tax=Streptomyces subrutilus TaxID=36818 RepID=A0A918REF7_9ACTN|nr:hypothetical protein GCM10010371_63440 [Streptomyces subrutilus]
MSGGIFSGLSVLGVPRSVSSAPNTVVQLPGGDRLVLNEQVHTADGSLTVTGLHYTSPTGLDISIASATCGSATSN